MKNKDPFNVAVGKRIREAREQAGLSRESLAEVAAISSQFLAELENGMKGASAKTICCLCKGLAVTPNHLLLDRDGKNTDLTFVEEALKSLNTEERETAQKIVSLLARLIKMH